MKQTVKRKIARTKMTINARVRRRLRIRDLSAEITLNKEIVESD